jgi:group I intron endonuclease
MTKTFIYKITNKINNKIYIGKTCNKNPFNRWARHLNTAKHKTTVNHTYQLIHKAINKYGKENFTFEVIEICNVENIGLEREKFWIEQYKSNVYKYGNEFGYNLTEGGDGSSGFKHSKESKEKMSKSRKGTRLGKENTFYGKHHSQKTKLIISKTHLGKKQPKEQVLKRSKLTINNVLKIRSECDLCINKRERNCKYKKLSKKYKISIPMIRLIYKRKRWADI